MGIKERLAERRKQREEEKQLQKEKDMILCPVFMSVPVAGIISVSEPKTESAWFVTEAPFSPGLRNWNPAIR